MAFGSRALAFQPGRSRPSGGPGGELWGSEKRIGPRVASPRLPHFLRGIRAGRGGHSRGPALGSPAVQADLGVRLLASQQHTWPTQGSLGFAGPTWAEVLKAARAESMAGVCGEQTGRQRPWQQESDSNDLHPAQALPAPLRQVLHIHSKCNDEIHFHVRLVESVVQVFYILTEFVFFHQILKEG